MRTLIAEAVASGARRHRACALVGLSARTLERWRADSAEDARQGSLALADGSAELTDGSAERADGFAASQDGSVAC